jgi:Prohead core protein serine protease
MKSELLIETLDFNKANLKLESVEGSDKKKTYFMEGVFIQGDVKNQNGRIYPRHEIESAVKSINERLGKDLSILGEVDHPNNLQINLDRVSHVITEMKMDGSDGVGKLRIIEDMPMGKICKILLDTGVKLGVSSRGTGEVDHMGKVRGFDIVTIDIVAQPSAPDAYPKAIMEALQGYKKYNMIIDVATSSDYDPRAQKYLESEILAFIKEL